MSKTPEQTVVDTSQDPSLGYIKAREVNSLISSENGIITTQTTKGYVVNTLENVTKVINNVVETNVSADWNADEGPNAILNKPNLEIYTTHSDVDDAIANLINSAPGALNTLGELANALGNSANYASTITNELALKASITYVDDALANISDISIGNIEFNDTTLSIVGSDEVKDITIVTGNNKQFVFGADGTLTIPDTIQSSVNGIPKFASATDIILEAVNRVKVQGGTFKLASKTNGQRQLLLPQAGDMIYNSTVNAVQVYTGSVWVSLGSGGSGSALEGGSITDSTPDLGISIEGVAPSSNTAAGSVYIQGGADYSESGGPTAKGGSVTVAAGQGANDVDAAHGGDIQITSGPASRYAGNILIEGGGTYGASGQAGAITIQSGSSLSGTAGNITIQSGVGTGGMQIFEGALKMRGANVDITSAFESVKIRTGDVDEISNPATVWEFDNNGTLTVPGSITRADRLTLISSGATSVNTASVAVDGDVGRVFVRTDNGNVTKTWEFDINGNLKLPQGGDIVDSSGQSVLGGGSSFNTAAPLHLTSTTDSTSSSTGALIVDGGVGIAGNINAHGIKHTLDGNLHITGVDSSSLYVGAYADEQSLTAPVIVAKDSYDTFVQAALINSSQFGSADWVAYSNQGTDVEGWSDMGMTGSNFNDISYSITHANDGYFFVQGLTGQGGNMVLATGNKGGDTHRDIVFATGGFLVEHERMRLNHEDTTLYVGGHAEIGGTNVTNLDVNGDVKFRSHTDLGAVANVKITGGTSGKVLSTDGSGNLSWVSPQSGPAGADGAPGTNGTNGTNGQGFTFRGAYNSGTIYTPYDVVTYQGSAYTCIATAAIGTHSDPSTDTSKFSLMASKGQQGIQGVQGNTGAQGVSVTLQGTLALISDLDNVVSPAQGDAWIVTESNGGDLYFRTSSGTWDNIGKIVGPEGLQGPQGFTGDTGPQGDPGAPGTPADTGNFTFSGDTLTSPTNGLIKIANTDDSAGIHSLNNRGRMWFDSTNNFYLVVDNTYQHSFSANGKVTFGGGYTFPNVSGTNGQILVTNGSGELSWHDQAGLTNLFDQDLNTSNSVTFNDVTSTSLGFPFAGSISQQDGDVGRYDIRIDAESNVVIKTNESTYQWTLGNDGSTTFPNGAKLNNGTANQFATDNQATTSLDLRDFSGAGFYTDTTGFTLRSSGSQNWVFGTDGKLTVPGSSPFATSGGMTIKNHDADGTTYLDGNGNDITLQVDPNKTIYVTVGDAVWSFGNAGAYPDNVLKLPVGGDIVDSTGTSVLGGSGGNPFDQALNTTDAPSFGGITVNGSVNYANGVTQQSGAFVNCNSNLDTVIYTSMDQYNHTLKLLLCIEGVEDGQSQLDTQSCEMVVAKSHRNNTVAGSAYGLVYTSTNPLVTLTTRWNATSNRIEVLCRPVSAMNGVSVHVTCTEMSTSQI